jgi:hypothetical protein
MVKKNSVLVGIGTAAVYLIVQKFMIDNVYVLSGVILVAVVVVSSAIKKA